ncbi:MAG: T9SS type A sorting domain-containing protein [Chitinophagales bacterium]
MKYWTVPPKKILITAAGTVVSTLPGASEVQYEVSNGVYEQNGTPIFYVVDLTIYNSTGTSIGALNCLSSGINTYCTEGEEISIVPVPNTCRQYYVIYEMGGGISGSAVGYAKLDCSSGVTIVQNGILIDTWGGNASSIAVSKTTNSTGNRYLFAMGYSSLKRYSITNTGFSSGLTIVDITNFAGNFDWQSSQLVLSPDQNKLCWAAGGGFTNKIFEISLNAYAFSAATSFTLTGDTYLHGVEFNSTSTRIFVSTNSGLKWASWLSSTFTLISSSSTYNNTQFGLGLNNYIYCLNNIGKYGRIDANITVPTVNSTFPTIINYGNASYPNLGSSCYRLPDQVDGDDYTYFFGIPISGSWLQTTCTFPAGVQPSNSCTSPTIVSANIGGILASGIGSSITSWTVGIQEYSSYCAIPLNGLNVSYTYSASGSFSSVFKSYNDIIFAATGMSNWWTNNPNKKFHISYYVTNSCGNTATTSGWVINSDFSCKGSLDMYQQKSLTIFPNPASRELTVADIPQGVTQIYITDVEGKIIKAVKIFDAAEIILPVSELSDGIYLLRTEGQQSVVNKFIVKN